MKLLAPIMLAFLTSLSVQPSMPEKQPEQVHGAQTACGNSGDPCRYNSDCCSSTCLRNDTCR